MKIKFSHVTREYCIIIIHDGKLFGCMLAIFLLKNLCSCVAITIIVVLLNGRANSHGTVHACAILIRKFLICISVLETTCV